MIAAVALIVVIIIVLVSKQMFPSNNTNSVSTGIATGTIGNFTQSVTTAPPQVTTVRNTSAVTSVSTSGATESSAVSTDSDGFRTMYVHRYVYLHDKPGVDENVIITLSIGLEVKVGKLVDDVWYEVLWDGKIGYAHKNYFGDTKPDRTTGTTTQLAE